MSSMSPGKQKLDTLKMCFLKTNCASLCLIKSRLDEMLRDRINDYNVIRRYLGTCQSTMAEEPQKCKGSQQRLINRFKWILPPDFGNLTEDEQYVINNNSAPVLTLYDPKADITLITDASPTALNYDH